MKMNGLFFQSIFKIAIVLMLCLKITNSDAQTENNENEIKMKNALYVDFSTRGAYYSINYDRIFYQKKVKFSYRIGLSILPDEISLPVGINLLLGKKNSYCEIGLTGMPYVLRYATYFSSHEHSDKFFYITPAIGYRYQKSEGRLLFKVAVSPMVVLDPPSDNFWKMDPKLYLAANLGIGFVF